MSDYRDRLKPLESVMSKLDNIRKDSYRRLACEMIVRGYSRKDIADHMGVDIHTAGQTVANGRTLLGAVDDIEMVLIAYGIPLRHDRPLSKYMDILKMGDVRTNRYVFGFVDLLVRGYKWRDIAKMLGKSSHTLSVVGKNSMDKLGMSSWVDMTLLAHDLIDGREFCLDGILAELTRKKVSGTLRGNAEQLPRSEAEGSEETGHAELVGGDQAHGDLGGVPVLPRKREAPPADQDAR